MTDAPKTNMTVEDRLAEKLKLANFADWFGEDDLRELTGKALEKAFFKERDSDPGGYHNKKLPPLVVELATAHVTKKIDEIAEARVKQLFAEDPAILEAVMARALDKTLEEVVLKAFANALGYVIAGHDWNMQERIRNSFGLKQ